MTMRWRARAGAAASAAAVALAAAGPTPAGARAAFLPGPASGGALAAGPALPGVRVVSVLQPGRPATSGVDRNRESAFSVSVVPAVPVPVRVGARFGIHLSSGTAGYALALHHG